MRTFFVYILASKSRRLYTGVTSNLPVRLYEHVNGLSEHTSKYRIDRLVYYETTNNAIAAIEREKQIKGLNRAKRIALIESMNPTWDDLGAPLIERPNGGKADPSVASLPRDDRTVGSAHASLD